MLSSTSASASHGHINSFLDQRQVAEAPSLPLIPVSIYFILFCFLLDWVSLVVNWLISNFKKQWRCCQTSSCHSIIRKNLSEPQGQVAKNCHRSSELPQGCWLAPLSCRNVFGEGSELVDWERLSQTRPHLSAFWLNWSWVVSVFNLMFLTYFSSF